MNTRALLLWNRRDELPDWLVNELFPDGVPYSFAGSDILDMAYRYLNDDYYRQVLDTYGKQGSTSQGLLQMTNEGKIDPYSMQTLTGLGGQLELNESQTQSLNNLLSRYISQNNLNWEAAQLNKLGLSSAGVLQTGGAHTAVDMSNPATSKAERRHQTSMKLIDMAGKMASAGIYGTSLGLVRRSAAKAASLFAHSASTY